MLNIIISTLFPRFPLPGNIFLPGILLTPFPSGVLDDDDLDLPFVQYAGIVLTSDQS